MEYQHNAFTPTAYRGRFLPPLRGVSMTTPAALPRRPLRPILARRRLTTAEIVKRLDVTTLAVGKWREGSSQRPPLPYTVERVGLANRVYIDEADLIAWLDVHRPDLKEVWCAQ